MSRCKLSQASLPEGSGRCSALFLQWVRRVLSPPSWVYNTAGIQRAPKLPDMSNQRNRVNPYRSRQTWGRKPCGGQWRCGYGSAKGSECCAVTAQIEVASPVRDNIMSPETEQTFRRCSHSRPFMEPMQETKQMTTAQAVGAASHTPGEFPIAV